jgi:hypothetical protein
MGGKGYFFKVLFEFPLEPAQTDGRTVSKSRAAFFFENTLGTEVCPLQRKY